MLKVGEAAPDFTAADDQGHTVTLSQFRGKSPVVLVFYPMDGTPVCTTQLCEFRDAYAELQARGMVVLGVNPGSEGSHRQFVERQKLPFPLVVDEGKRIARAYKTVLGWGVLSITNRSVYVVGTDGKIAFAQLGKPTPQEILKALGTQV